MSAADRLVASETNATTRPSAEIAGGELEARGAAAPFGH